MKFEKDFDFESANAQFNKEDIDKEFQSKLKLKGNQRTSASVCTGTPEVRSETSLIYCCFTCLFGGVLL